MRRTKRGSDHRGTVLYVARMVPHYRHAALARLNARLGHRLVVCAGAPPKASSMQSLIGSTQKGYPLLPLRNLWVGGQKLHMQAFGPIFRHYPAPSVVIAEESVRSATLPFLLWRAKRAGAARLLWGHFSSNRRPFALDSPATRYRLMLARSVEGCICYSASIATMLQPHVDPARLFAAPNTLDTGQLLTLRAALERSGRRAIRQRLELHTDAPVFVYLGRLIRAKGTKMLLDTFAQLRKRHAGAELVVIGEGPDRELFESKARKSGGIRLLGAITDWEASAPYLYAADLLLNPGYLGLSINHAFALGLPVVSQASPDPRIRYHSPEIDYLTPGENGLLTPYGSVEAMAEAATKILNDRERFAGNALAFARARLGLDVMLDGILRAVAFAEADQPKPCTAK